MEAKGTSVLAGAIAMETASLALVNLINKSRMTRSAADIGFKVDAHYQEIV